MVARDPSRLGQFLLGYGRLGVYHTPYWEDLFAGLAQSVTWRIRNTHVDRDTTTGWREPDYTLTHTINGIVEEQGGTLLPLPSGVVQQGDAVFRCFDNVVVNDQIYLPESQRYCEVVSVRPVYEYLREADVTSFCYRICDLHYLELYYEG